MSLKQAVEQMELEISELTEKLAAAQERSAKLQAMYLRHVLSDRCGLDMCDDINELETIRPKAPKETK